MLRAAKLWFPLLDKEGKGEVCSEENVSKPRRGETIPWVFPSLDVPDGTSPDPSLEKEGRRDAGSHLCSTYGRGQVGVAIRCQYIYCSQHFSTTLSWTKAWGFH
jgi:hypothetical protein